ncbi:MAG: hypothetical protein K940chlam3_00727 [Chlamydiae bacterium]|nr:hypothetical protein [Chlamydiota bacterium]
MKLVKTSILVKGYSTILIEDHIKDYFSQVSDKQEGGSFYKVIVLHDSPDVSWEDISLTVPSLSRGWYELAQLETPDRVEFTRDYWISKLPFHPKSLESISQFFDCVEDIGIVVAQKHTDGPLVAHMIYAFKDGNGFFHGCSPMTEEESIALQEMFAEFILPEDYMAFMEVHNGFSKSTDSGIISTRIMPEVCKRFYALVDTEASLLTTQGKVVDPQSLIPFYESFGRPFFQCFWKEWYPKNEMGNVYYSGSTNTVSDPGNGRRENSMTFPTFLDWFFFYLESIG